MPARPRIRQTVLDGPDPRALAEFYRALLGLEYRDGDEPPAAGADDPRGADWLVLRDPDGGHGLAFQAEPEHVATTWPDPSVPLQAHLDCAVGSVAELLEASARLRELGAPILREALDDPEEPIVVAADPAGHPVCIFVAS